MPRLTALLAALTVLGLGAAAPAPASAAPGVDIVRPADGATVPEGTVVLEFTTGETGGHYYAYDCDDGTSLFSGVSVEPGQSTVTVALDSGTAGSACTVSVEAPSGATDGVSFQVQPRVVVPEIRNLSGPATFYPRVRDGFRDDAWIAFGTRLDSRVTITVRNARGTAVRTAILRPDTWSEYYERREWRWNGRDRHGRPVAVGRYRVVVASTLDGLTRQASTAVSVATGWRTRAVTKVKDGWYDSTDSVSEGCYSDEWYEGGNHLDCWGGRYARATYRFALPAGARGVEWRIRGTVMCCDRGRLIRTGERVSRTAFRVQVTVTGWRSYIVRRVELSYRERARI